MNSKNLNYLYYVEYFDGLDLMKPKTGNCEKSLQDKNRELIEFETKDVYLMNSLSPELAPHKIELQTVYPGLLIGTGIAHGFGGKGEAALGLCLDYVTGMPYIPGSSVKGVLRSAFKHHDYIKQQLKNIKVENAESISIDELEARIFGNPIKEKKYHVNINEQDIFYDAVIVSTGNLLATDAITSHRHNPKLLELAEPNPVTMIRIRPGVNLLFQFSLKEKTLGVTADQKMKLFRIILKDFGIGAKTNVGYGLLIEPENAVKLKKMNENNDFAAPIFQPGVCRECGKPTKQNPKTGGFYQICGDCKFTKKK